MYFFDLSENFTTKAWYLLLRGAVNVAFGVAVWFLPALVFSTVSVVFALWLIFNAMLVIVPILNGRSTRRLWPQVLISASLGFAVGLILLLNQALAIEVVTVAVGLILLIRALLEFSIFVETRARVQHQRALLLGSAMLMLAGCSALSGMIGGVTAVHMVALYAALVGLMHMLTAWRVSENLQEMSLRKGATEIETVPILDPSSLGILDELDLKPIPEERLPYAKAKHRSTRLDLSRYHRPLILTPHPDDLEGFCGGLVYQLDSDAVSVVFAGGDKGVWKRSFQAMGKDEYIQVRLQEAANAAKLLGVKEIVYLGYRDRHVTYNEEGVQMILRLFEHYRPDLVLAFEYYRNASPYPHPDHLASARMVRDAVARYRGQHPLDYLVTATLIPNVFLDVSGVRSVKLDALACHSTQNAVNRIIFPFFEKSISRLWGVVNGVQYAESYRRINISVLKAKQGIDQHESHNRA